MIWGSWLTVLNILTGGGLVFAGSLLHRVTRGLPAGGRPQYVCSCGDGYGMHHTTEGCQAEHLVKVNNLGRNELRKCRCLRYDGPEPPPNISELWKELS